MKYMTFMFSKTNFNVYGFCEAAGKLLMCTSGDSFYCFAVAECYKMDWKLLDGFLGDSHGYACSNAVYIYFPPFILFIAVKN